MNQTVTANISGIVFHIEVDAYEKLKSYLNKIKSYFRNSDGSEEIMTDIEARIAELFNERLTSKSQVVTNKVVEEVIAIMGKPEQYLDEDATEREQASDKDEDDAKTPRQLFRDTDNRVIGGVASGLGAYFGINPVWLRLAWVCSIIFFGFGFLLYIILWIIIPEAKTASDRLKMKGEPVNFKNIGKTFEEGAEKMRDRFQDMDKAGFGNKVESFFHRLADVIATLLKGLFKAIGKILGLIFLVIGVCLAFFFLAGFNSSDMVWTINSREISTIDLPGLFTALLGTEYQFTIAKYALMGLLGIPILAIILASLKLLFNVKRLYGIGIAMTVLWLFSLMACAFVGLQIGSHFSAESRITNQIPVNGSYSTLILSSDENNIPGEQIAGWNRGRFLSLDDSNIYRGYPLLDIVKSPDDSLRLKIIKSSRGNTKKEALDKANSIQYAMLQRDDRLFFDAFIAFSKQDKLRGQEVELTLQLPVGTAVYLDLSLEDMIYDIHNVTDTYDRDMLGHTWVMTAAGLSCGDCQE